MSASEKLQRFDAKDLHARVVERRPKTALETIYRWAKAIETGEGVRDDVKLLLIDATAGTPFALCWADFMPVRKAAGVAA